jgi:hypothetical protein
MCPTLHVHRVGPIIPPRATAGYSSWKPRKQTKHAQHTQTGRRRPDGEQGAGGLRRDQVHARLPLCQRDDPGAVLLFCAYPLSPSLSTRDDDIHTYSAYAQGQSNKQCHASFLIQQTNIHTNPQKTTHPQIGKIRLPVSDYPVALTELAFHPTGTALNITLDPSEVAMAGAITRSRNRSWMTFDSSFIVYMIALVSFVGWFLFAVRACVRLLCLCLCACACLRVCFVPCLSPGSWRSVVVGGGIHGVILNATKQADTTAPLTPPVPTQTIQPDLWRRGAGGAAHGPHHGLHLAAQAHVGRTAGARTAPPAGAGGGLDRGTDVGVGLDGGMEGWIYVPFMYVPSCPFFPGLPLLSIQSHAPT